MSSNQNVRRACATMLQDVLLHFFGDLFILKRGQNMKKLFCCLALEFFLVFYLYGKQYCCPALKIFSCLLYFLVVPHLWKTVRLPGKKATKCNKMLSISIQNYFSTLWFYLLFRERGFLWAFETLRLKVHLFQRQKFLGIQWLWSLLLLLTRLGQRHKVYWHSVGLKPLWKCISIKGQIISKCLSGVFNLLQKTNENK